ncbi:hypothetical protein FEM48_Zijuj04G0123300 [Ziziphus jujuba var. spinosa]|uniref:Diacylglycerol O-acyltransferase n=1 Tax=Ziziphus jujuba var. spinosa TaxID=714518 RepID=A0A978VJU8_ZIZJJ|nr:hypothetical protein FEM48_Zijuj04G0123300 [Ziziphus jujuba var. spinosa]
MEFEGEMLEPVSPLGQYCNSSVLSISVLAVLEIGTPIDDSQTISLIRDLLLPIHPRFSCIMVGGVNEYKKWKKVEVKIEDHVHVPIFPSGLSIEAYDRYFDDYVSKIALERFPQDRPLWEIHIIKYPTSNAAGNVIFKLHHALGDGYSLMGALLCCLQRADNPSIPLTFPSRKRTEFDGDCNRSLFSFVPKICSAIFNTALDLSWSIIKSNLIDDEITPIRTGTYGVEFLPITITSLTLSLDQIKSIKSKLGAKSSNSRSAALMVLNTRMMGGDYKSIKEMLNPDNKMPWGNKFSFMHIAIPKLKECPNPLDFVWHAQKIVKRKRRSLVVYLNSLLVELVKKLRGPEAAAKYVFKKLNRSSMSISNLIGPVEQMTLNNHPVKGLYFAAPGIPEDYGVTIMSYSGQLRIVFKMVRKHVDPHKLKSCVQNAFESIREAADKFPPRKN